LQTFLTKYFLIHFRVEPLTVKVFNYSEFII